MAYDIGTARGVIEMEYNGRGVDQAEDDLKGLEKGGRGAQQSLNKVSNTAGLAGAAIAGGLALAVNAAANFEQRMSAVGAVSGATDKQMDALSAKALQLGKDTSFSATESAQAIEELVKAGLSVKDVLNGAADATVNLAAAGEVSMPEAATIASNAMNQFGLSAEDMVNVADKIAGAANASAIDVSDFGQSLSQVGAVAHLAGVGFDDTATAIALMGNAGIKGSDAGTSLKSMFMRLQPTTEKQAKLMKELGIITEDGANKFYDAEGNTKRLADVSQVLQNSLKGMTKQQKQAALSTLFGSDAIRGAAILSDKGSKGFYKMRKAMDKVSAADVAKKRLDNFNGSLEQLKGSLETAGIGIGMILLPALRDMVDQLTDAVNWFLSLSEETQKYIAYGSAAAAALLLIVAAVGKFLIFASELIKALKILRLAFAATWVAGLGPIALIIAAIALIGIALFLLYKKSARFRDLVAQVWAGVQEAVAAFVDFFVSEVYPEIKKIIDLILQSWDQLAHGTGGALGDIREYVAKLLPLILDEFEAVFGFLVTFVSAIWGALKGIIMGGLKVIQGIINLVMGIISGDWAQVWLGVKQILSGAFTAISAIVKAWATIMVALLKLLWATIKVIFKAGLALLVLLVKAYLMAVKAVWTGIWNGIKAFFKGLWAGIVGIARSAASSLVGAIRSAWNAVKGATSTAWTAIRDAVRSAITGLINMISALPAKMLAALGDIVSSMYEKGKEIVQALIDGIGAMAGALAEKAKSVIGGGIGKIIPGSPVKEGPLRKLNKGHAGKQIVQFLIDGIDAMSDPLASAMATAMPSVDAGSYASPSPKVRGKVRGKKRGGAKGRLRMIRGELSIDAQGRAFITGVAESTVDDDDDYDDTLGRMGR